jgi:glycosyltransferase involved in cell wall biosynthesis
MRICLYTETALPMLGGQELTVDALARQFIEQHHDVVVLAPTPRSPLGAEDRSLPYRVFRHPRFVSTRYFVPWYRRYLYRLHRGFRFDVLHCHSLYPTGYLGVLARPRLGVPVVITSHGGDVAPDNRLFKKPGLYERHVMAAANADALVAISRFAREGFERLLPGAAVREIPNGVDIAALSTPAARPPELASEIRPRQYILFLGRLTRRKGVDLLLDAVATLQDTTRPLVIVAGSGEEQGALERQAAQSGIADAIRFVGQVRGAMKRYLLQNAIATVMPSRDWEAFPLVVLESFAAGTPVIATEIPGLRDLVVPGHTGWLVAPETLAQALCDAAKNPLHARQMGENARKDALSRDWALIASQHIDLYEELSAHTMQRARRGEPAA